MERSGGSRRIIIVQPLASDKRVWYPINTIEYGDEGELGLLSETLQPHRAPEPGIEEIHKESRFYYMSETRSSVKAYTESFLLRFGTRVAPRITLEAPLSHRILIRCGRGVFCEHMKENSELVAQKVSDWTQEAQTMLPKTPGDIRALLEQNRAATLENDGQVVAFGAITYEWPDGWKELGAVVVEPSHRKRGLGHQVVQRLIDLAKNAYPEAGLFALCNEHSLPLFLDAGAEVITNPSVLPVEVWSACADCQRRDSTIQAGKLCCDTPVRIT